MLLKQAKAYNMARLHFYNQLLKKVANVRWKYSITYFYFTSSSSFSITSFSTGFVIWILNQTLIVNFFNNVDLLVFYSTDRLLFYSYAQTIRKPIHFCYAMPVTSVTNLYSYVGTSLVAQRRLVIERFNLTDRRVEA